SILIYCYQNSIHAISTSTFKEITINGLENVHTLMIGQTKTFNHLIQITTKNVNLILNSNHFYMSKISWNPMDGGNIELANISKDGKVCSQKIFILDYFIYERFSLLFNYK